MIPKHGTRGKIAERKTLKFLREKGLELIQENYHCRYGEIDMIMQEANTLVFVEVRYRLSTAFGGALESVTQQKISKIKRTAEHYLMTNNLTDVACRFDMVGLSGKLRKPEINWLQNAF